MFSVIIPVYNDCRVITCLESIIQQNYPSEKYEIIIIEDGDHKFKQLVESKTGPTIKYVAVPRGGSFNARNIGIYNASYPICAFTDADCIADINWLKNAEQYFADNKSIILGGQISLTLSDQPTYIEYFESLFYLNQLMYIQMYNFFTTANCFIPKELFTKHGSFAGVANAEEEKDLCTRFHDCGIQLTLSDSVEVFHPAKTGLKEFTAGLRRDVESQLLFKQLRSKNYFNLFKQKVNTFRYYVTHTAAAKLSLIIKIKFLLLILYISILNIYYLLRPLRHEFKKR